MVRKQKGGRGKKADYQTKTFRVPEPLWSEVTQLINDFHDSGSVPSTTYKETVTELKVGVQTLLEQLKAADIKPALAQALPRGVSRRTNGKFLARVNYQGQTINLGTFDTKEEAEIAVQQGSKRIAEGKHPKR